jgi:PBSX family phage terminase large subunit
MATLIDVDEDVFLECYRHLLHSECDIHFLWGGRDSGKSVFIAQKLLLECLSAKYFRCILIRKVHESIKDSQWQLLKDWAVEWGIDHLFNFKSSPLEINCLVNGNKFIARGCDKPEKLKSITNPSDAWYEEGNQLTEADHITVSTTLRSAKGRVREWFSFNPEAEGDFEEFFLYKNYFKEKCEAGIYTFNAKHTMTLPDLTTIDLNYSSTHTTYQDNPYCSRERIARHETLKHTNPYYYRVFTLGLWGRRISGGEFYKCYSSAKQEVDIRKIEGFDLMNLGRPYNPELVLHLTFDFNNHPYITGNVWQGRGKWVGKIAEILLPHPRNTSMAVCEEFTRLFFSHTAGLIIYGDPGGLKQSTADETTVRVKEKDYSEFTKIRNWLIKYRPEQRVPRAYPDVKPRGQFINSIFESNLMGIEIVFDIGCKRSHSEYSNLKENSDGTKHKEEYINDQTGVKAQKWGHISDADDYFITSYFANEFRLFQSGGEQPSIRIGRNTQKGIW